MGYIYKITNLLNGDFYIGQTITTLQHRFNQHKTASSSRSNMHIARAIQKYGKENFKIELIEECDNSLLNKREDYWIATLKPRYNIKLKNNSAVSTTWNKRPVRMYSLQGDYIKTFPSIIEAGQWLLDNNYSFAPDKYRLVPHICDCCFGKIPTAYQFLWRYEEEFNDILHIQPIKLSENKQGLQRPLRMITPDNKEFIFNSQSECADYIIENNLLSGTKKNISVGISNCCLEKRKQYRGFQFRYIK